MDEPADWKYYPCQRLTGAQYLDIFAEQDKWIKASNDAASRGSSAWPPVIPVPKDMGEGLLHTIVECAFRQNNWSCIFLEVEGAGCWAQVWGWFGRGLEEIPKYTRATGTEETSQIQHPALGTVVEKAKEFRLERSGKDLITIISIETNNGDGQSISIPSTISRLYHVWPFSITSVPTPGSDCSGSSEEATLRDYHSDGQDDNCEDLRAQAMAKFDHKILDSLDSSLQIVLPGSDSRFLANRVFYELSQSQTVALDSSDRYLFFSTIQLSRALQQAAMRVLGKHQLLQMQMCAVAEEIRGLGFNTTTLVLEVMDACGPLASSHEASELSIPSRQSRLSGQSLCTTVSSDNVLKCISDVVKQEKCGVELPVIRFLDALGKDSSAQMLRSTIEELGADVVADIVPTIQQM